MSSEHDDLLKSYLKWSDFTPEQLLGHFEAQYQSAYSALPPANILITGKTGVGKSTMVNAIFRKPLAETGIGKPVTARVTEYSDPELPVWLYDTPGVELGKEAEEVTQDFLAEIKKRLTPDPSQHIHLLWYCVLAESRRMEDYEVDLIRRLARHVPVILVMTQCLGEDDENAQTFAHELESWKLPIVQHRPIPILAVGRRIGRQMIEPFGLEALVEVTSQVLPDAARAAFANAQGVIIQLKVDEARRGVLPVASGLAFGIGAIPIPVADAVPLVALQVGMFARVAVVMGVDLKDGVVRRLVRDFAVTGPGAAVLGGRAAASALLKLIPGLGTVISGAVAAAITGALGEAFILVCAEILRRRMAGQPLKESEMLKLLLDGFQRSYRPAEGDTPPALPA